MSLSASISEFGVRLILFNKKLDYFQWKVDDLQESSKPDEWQGLYMLMYWRLSFAFDALVDAGVCLGHA